MNYKFFANNKIYVNKPTQKYHHSKDEVYLIKTQVRNQI